MKITAKVIADSITENKNRLTTFELEYPRFIHSQFMTHKMISKNSASSRAIKVSNMINNIENNMAQPIFWGKEKSGMSPNGIENNSKIDGKAREQLWEEAYLNAKQVALKFHEAGYHKSIVNRILEPFSMMKVVTTATEWDNFFGLRCHTDAQDEIIELADKMLEAINNSAPVKLFSNDWHLPYYKDGFVLSSETRETIDNAIKISVSCCAQVSYRLLDDSVEKAIKIYDRLITSRPVHASPTEHQATPIVDISDPWNFLSWQNGITHVDKNSNLWSANFKGWVQYRKLVSENTIEKFEGLNHEL